MVQKVNLVCQDYLEAEEMLERQVLLECLAKMDSKETGEKMEIVDLPVQKAIRDLLVFLDFQVIKEVKECLEEMDLVDLLETKGMLVSLWPKSCEAIASTHFDKHFSHLWCALESKTLCRFALGRLGASEVGLA